MLWIAAVFAVLAVSPAALSDRVVGCYFGSWAGYRQGEGAFSPDYIDPSLCTHLYYAFVGVSTEGGITILDSWNDLPSGKNFMGKFNAVKAANPKAKTIVSIGGWNAGSYTFSTVANSANLRSAFAKNAADFTQQYGFDGFDIDWEYPADRGGVASDVDAFVELLKEMRAEFSKRGLLLTAAVGASQARAQTSYKIAEIAQLLDYVNLMTYDFHGSWDTATGHNAPLYASSVDTDLTFNVDYCVRYWLDNGTPANKLVLGIGTYGRSFTLASTSQTGLGAPIAGAGNAGPYTATAGTLGYNEFCTTQGWTVVFNDEIQAPYAYKGNQWVGLDDARSVAIKAQYAIDKGLAGAFIWSIETDDFHGDCGPKYPLLTSIYNTLNGAPAPTVATPPSASSSSTTTTTTRAPNNGGHTGGNTSGVCSSDGYTRDPNDCATFYYCQADGQGGFTKYEFHCAATLAYDPSTNQCNYANQVAGC